MYQLRTNCLKSLSTSSRTLQTFTQQYNNSIITITPCLLFILQPSICITYLRTFLHSQSHHVLTKGYSLSTDQSNRSPGFLNFQLTNTTTWLWRWHTHRLSKRQSLTTVLHTTPITQMIFFNQGIIVLLYIVLKKITTNALSQRSQFIFKHLKMYNESRSHPFLLRCLRTWH